MTRLWGWDKPCQADTGLSGWCLCAHLIETQHPHGPCIVPGCGCQSPRPGPVPAALRESR